MLSFLLTGPRARCSSRCSSRCVTELQMAPSKCMLHPYAVCKAYPWIAVSTTSLIMRTISRMPNIPAVVESKVTNPFHTREAVLSTILLSEASSNKLYIEIASPLIEWPNIFH